MPAWYRSPWYERLCGAFFGMFDALEGADQFIAWLQARRVVGVLHG
jgi:hypothetical protein